MGCSVLAPISIAIWLPLSDVAHRFQPGQGGFAVDENGCQLCACAEPPPTLAQVTQRPTERSCPPVCSIACEHGHVLDANDCPTCSCNQAPVSMATIVVRCLAASLLSRAHSRLICPFGGRNSASNLTGCFPSPCTPGHRAKENAASALLHRSSSGCAQMA